MNDNDISLKNFKLNKEGRFSITRPYESNQIIAIAEKYVGDLTHLIITDATSCMGGDLVNFSRACKYVNGIEIDPDNFHFLVKNAMKFNCKNVNLFCQDYLSIYKSLKQDIIYMDPPWGGVDYKTKKSVSLKLGDRDLWSIIMDIKELKLSNYVFIKVPANICLDLIEYDEIASVYNRSKSVSFKLIIINLREFKNNNEKIWNISNF